MQEKDLRSVGLGWLSTFQWSLGLYWLTIVTSHLQSKAPVISRRQTVPELAGRSICSESNTMAHTSESLRKDYKAQSLGPDVKSLWYWRIMGIGIEGSIPESCYKQWLAEWPWPNRIGKRQQLTALRETNLNENKLLRYLKIHRSLWIGETSSTWGFLIVNSMRKSTVWHSLSEIGKQRTETVSQP